MIHRMARLLFFVLMTTVPSIMVFIIVTAFLLTPVATAATETMPIRQNTPTADDDRTGDTSGQEYIVQPGDSLYEISGQFYGVPDNYQQIVNATNAKAAVDDRFARITDPRIILVGQRLWIPNDSIGAQSASVNFVAPLDGAVVAPTFVVTMTASALTVEPAGEINPDAGHFHILVDTDFVDAGEVIITDEQHLHFGKGQMTTTLTLEPGEHLLRLQFANGAHIALDGEQYRDEITVTVAEGEMDGMMMDGPGVAFVDPLDGATVPPTFEVTMMANELTVEPAGEINPDAGHFHILVDTDFVDAGEVIITDEQHLHFGKGQMTTTLTLEPGEHLLRLQFANGAHIALDGEQYRDEITVTVAEGEMDGMMMDGPGVAFVDPLDGATVPPTFEVTMMANELTVEPAGEINPDAGHFHILVDTDFVDAGEVIITDEQHLHFGKGQMTTTLTLEPGEHLLRLQFANGAHIALDGEQYRDEITVTVAEGEMDGMMMDGPGVAFVDPLDGATVPPTFEVTMMANELTVEPAGEINPDAGHFHILVDTDFVDAGEVIITDEQHLHFGKGQMTTTLTLEPGEHLLRLQFANGAHIALDGEQYRDEITVTVAEGEMDGMMMDGPGVAFVDPLDGATVPPTFEVTMMANELTVEPAGEINPDAGHFHILVDTDFVDAGEVIITDEQHLHFGKGQMTTTLTLEPGEHLLRLQFANGAHIALDGEQYRDEITVTVDSGAETENSPAAATAEAIDVYFVTPQDGAIVSPRVDVVMAADGLIVEPSGEINANAGHFHILIDTDFVPAGDVIITDEQHLHFGKGEAVTRLNLEPGEYLLRLQFANGAHIALDGEQYQDEILITVEE